MASLFQELKRRHVFKVAAAYVVTAWLVAQVAEFFLESFEAPEWALQSILVLLALGFPIALVLAWAFELKPEAPSGEVDDVEAEPAPLLDAAEATPATPAQSIAVLPFVDMSAGGDQEYFSDGLSEELLNLLAKVQGLHVASRTSAFSFKGKLEDIRSIAEKLSVRHVLEGSVRQAGDQLRVTAQLIKAEDGYHLWSETFDRPLDNIFAVQDEIAAAVVDALKVRLLGDAPTVRETSTEAYNLYLQGAHCMAQRSHEALGKAIEFLEQVVELDPAYAPAWAMLSGAYAIQGGSTGGSVGWEAAVARSRKAANRAVELDPALPKGWISLCLLKSYYEWDWPGAEADVERARALAPNSSEVYSAKARLARTHGRLEESIRHCERAIELDPLDNDARADMARAFLYLGRYGEAESAFRDLVRLNPNHRNAASMIGRVHLGRGDIDAALSQSEGPGQVPFWAEFKWLLISYTHRRSPECEARLAAFVDEFGHNGAFQIAEIYALAGEADAAFGWLQKAVAQRDPGLPDELLVTDTLRPLHDDPRWEPLVDQLGLLDSYRSMPPVSH